MWLGSNREVETFSCEICAMYLFVFLPVLFVPEPTGESKLCVEFQLIRNNIYKLNNQNGSNRFPYIMAIFKKWQLLIKSLLCGDRLCPACVALRPGVNVLSSVTNGSMDETSQITSSQCLHHNSYKHLTSMQSFGFHDNQRKKKILPKRLNDLQIIFIGWPSIKFLQVIFMVKKHGHQGVGCFVLYG